MNRPSPSISASGASGRISIEWVPRLEPLTPVAVAAFGGPARVLATRVLRGHDERLLRLRGVSSDGALVLIGEPSDLPWVDGAIYLGRDPNAPSLLLPTASQPAIAVALLERAILSKCPTDRPARPIAVTIDPPRILPAGAALPLVRRVLEQWLTREAAR